MKLIFLFLEKYPSLKKLLSEDPVPRVQHIIVNVEREVKTIFETLLAVHAHEEQ